MPDTCGKVLYLSEQSEKVFHRPKDAFDCKLQIREKKKEKMKKSVQFFPNHAERDMKTFQIGPVESFVSATFLTRQGSLALYATDLTCFSTDRAQATIRYLYL